MERSHALQLIFNHYLKTPDYLLLNKILDIENEYDVRSTFFWLVNSGKGTRRINNADYEIDAAPIKRSAKKYMQEVGKMDCTKVQEKIPTQKN